MDQERKKMFLAVVTTDTGGIICGPSITQTRDEELAERKREFDEDLIMFEDTDMPPASVNMFNAIEAFVEALGPDMEADFGNFVRWLAQSAFDLGRKCPATEQSAPA